MMQESIDLSRYIRPGDTIWWNQGTAEPLRLTESLVRQRAEIGPCRAFLGVTSSTTLQAEHADFLSLLSYCGLGQNQRLMDAGMLDVIPCHYSQLPFMLDSGALPCDVLFLQVSPPGPDGKPSLGTAHDYLLCAARRARVVIAEINEQMPWTHGSPGVEDIRFDAIVHSNRPLLTASLPTIGDIERRIAAHVAEFINDGSVLEMGIGAVPDAIMGLLQDRRDLGIHSGMLGDSVVDLIEAGAVTNARKSIDRGVTTVGILLGTQRLYEFARSNFSLNFQPSTYTHAHSVLASINNFIAINSAIEVDLTGQINAEVLNGRYIGAIGGQTDFMRGAQAAKNGHSIIALPSSTRDGRISRIVSRLADGVVTTPRSESDIFVTEWGAAQLRGQPLQERMRRMIAIAHPDHREQLEREAFGC
ncbi:acetyl-CoA hydrolase/transferase family protein [Pollutimonas harenae]|uniref:Acetyl-CoA hydrolase/transferase family protein n=1 Tax=Pollutimonas harenae TaxID=657015 RepID=A0A853H9L4_9BURK|nr:acetyl-CoA hydrolase/transferase C-terminal domain-containing protein [Pollutimonas harenae]NYT86724.1 acetyl-CoA hydrolase/transferase family protein [Pollutimonas harenae]TEA71374.1 acetyl-CoA hydrolase/transferase family protein [Pollutimonas harenae]